MLVKQDPEEFENGCPYKARDMPTLDIQLEFEASQYQTGFGNKFDPNNLSPSPSKRKELDTEQSEED